MTGLFDEEYAGKYVKDTVHDRHEWKTREWSPGIALCLEDEHILVPHIMQKVVPTPTTLR